MTGQIHERQNVVGSVKTMFGAPLTLNLNQLNADVAFIGVPLPDGPAEHGPESVRKTRAYFYGSRRGDQPARGFYDYDSDTDCLQGVTMADCGDVPMDPRDVDGNYRRTEEAVQTILDRGAFPVVVGGSHAIAASSCRAFAAHQPIDVVHIDGHHDFYRPVRGKESMGALRRIAEGVPFARSLTTVGLRPADAPHSGRDIYEEMKRRGVGIVTARRFREQGVKEAISIVPQERRSIYVTLDVDVLDTALAPDVTYPAVGGLSYHEVSEILRELNARGTIVGLDVVSVTRSVGSTAWVAAQLILDLLIARFPSKPQV
jgi:agmatinase